MHAMTCSDGVRVRVQRSVIQALTVGELPSKHVNHVEQAYSFSLRFRSRNRSAGTRTHCVSEMQQNQSLQFGYACLVSDSEVSQSSSVHGYVSLI
jgi:molybdate-binding protein